MPCFVLRGAPGNMIKMVSKGVLQTLILVLSLFMLSIQVIITAMQIIPAAEMPENISSLLQEDSDQAGAAQQAGETAGASGASLSIQDQLLSLMFHDSDTLGGMHSFLFLLIALSCIPDLFPWRMCARPVRISGLIRAGLYLACGIPFLFNGFNDLSISIMNILYTAILIWEKVSGIKKKRSPGRIVLGTLVLVLALLNLLFFLPFPFLVLGLIILRSFTQILALSFSQIRMDILKKIIRKTYASEILLGLLLLIFAFSILLTIVDEGIGGFENALWFCFATVTTIGYGDVAVASPLGRILGVILGIYGIVVVALITSIIVNFYNETKSEKTDDTELPETGSAEVETPGTGEKDTGPDPQSSGSR